MRDDSHRLEFAALGWLVALDSQKISNCLDYTVAARAGLAREAGVLATWGSQRV